MAGVTDAVRAVTVGVVATGRAHWTGVVVAGLVVALGAALGRSEVEASMRFP